MRGVRCRGPPTPHGWSRGWRGPPCKLPGEGALPRAKGVRATLLTGSHICLPRGPRPGQEAGWRPEGGGLSNPELLKRANGEVKIGNKNKIAPASPGCLCRKQGISPPCWAGSAPGPSQPRNVPPPRAPPPPTQTGSAPERDPPESGSNLASATAQPSDPGRGAGRPLRASASWPAPGGRSTPYPRPSTPWGLPRASLCQGPLQDPCHPPSPRPQGGRSGYEHQTAVANGPGSRAAQTSISSSTRSEALPSSLGLPGAGDRLVHTRGCMTDPGCKTGRLSQAQSCLEREPLLRGRDTPGAEGPRWGQAVARVQSPTHPPAV